MDLKSIFTSGDAEEIIAACITGEKAAIKDYKEVLEITFADESLRELILKQKNGIEEALTTIKAQLELK